MSDVDKVRVETIVPASPRVDSPNYDARGKSPQEIESDIGETRAELGEILDELERKIAPRHLLEKGVDMLKDTMSGNGGKIGETLRNNPLPLALIGVGVGWMVMANSNGGRLGERISGAMQGLGETADRLAGQVKDQVRERAGRLSSRAAQAAETVDTAYARTKPGEPESWTGSESSGLAETAGHIAKHARHVASAGAGAAEDAARRAQEAGQAAWRRAGDYAGYAGDRLYRARDRFADLVQEHPLAIGALGLLAGVVVGLMLPSSRAEQRWIGPTRERLGEEAASLGREAVDRAEQVAGRAVDAATDAVKEELAQASAAMSQKSVEGSGTAPAKV